jgi:hypothetical protein
VTPVGTQNINITIKEPKRTPTRITEEYWPSQKLQDWVMKELPDVGWKLETQKFVDYFLSVSGSKGIKSDWDAAWRNWMRNSRKPKSWVKAKTNSKALEEWAND